MLRYRSSLKDIKVPALRSWRMHWCRGRLGVFFLWWLTMGPPLEAVHEARLALHVCNRLGMHGFACCCQVCAVCDPSPVSTERSSSAHAPLPCAGLCGSACGSN